MGSSGVPGGLCRKIEQLSPERVREGGREGERKRKKAKLLEPHSVARPITQLGGLINNARLPLFSLLSHYHSCTNQTVNTFSSRGEEKRGGERATFRLETVL